MQLIIFLSFISEGVVDGDFIEELMTSEGILKRSCFTPQ